MSLLTDSQLLSSESFVNRVTVALIRAAYNIKNEVDTTTNHAERLAMAEQILSSWSSARSVGMTFCPLVLTNATVQSVGANVTDNDIIFIVNSFLDTVAVRDYPVEAV